ncbi:hypothetical protein EMIT0P218_120040 [Pseudomonas sp. IT-P218]
MCRKKVRQGLSFQRFEHASRATPYTILQHPLHPPLTAISRLFDLGKVPSKLTRHVVRSIQILFSTD